LQAARELLGREADFVREAMKHSDVSGGCTYTIKPQGQMVCNLTWGTDLVCWAMLC